jgi:hypothetical protein
MTEETSIWEVDRRTALGALLDESAQLEYVLRMAFTALVGSKYAAVIAGGQDATWLIENCKAITKVHREIKDADRSAVLCALSACSQAYELRNRMVHDAWNPQDQAGRMHTSRSRRRSHVLVDTFRTVDDIRKAELDTEAAWGSLVTVPVNGHLATVGPREDRCRAIACHGPLVNNPYTGAHNWS